MDRRILVILALIVVGIAAIGFLRGTSDRDYAFQTGFQPGHPIGADVGRQARSYERMREATTARDGTVAGSCVDCHEDQFDPSAKGTRIQHPIGLVPPAGANLAALLAAGASLEATESHPNGELTCRTCHRPHGASEDSRLVVTADEGTLCVSCHRDKTPARSEHPINVPMSGAEQRTIVSLGGPDSNTLSCLSCHDPHGSSAGTLLRTDGKGNAACAACHKTEASALGSGHGGQTCVDCHGTHKAPARNGKGVVATVKADQSCVDCHAEQTANKEGHPLWVDDKHGGDGLVGCTDCHSPHGREHALPAAATVAATCKSCHEDKAALVGTAHDGKQHPVAGAKETCLTCHDMHGEGGRPARPSGVNPASASCLACHAEGKAAAYPGPGTHSSALLTTVSGLPFTPTGPSPYFNAAGKRTSTKGEITCETCHDTHGGAANFISQRQALLPYCAVCHGTETDTYFDRFHDEAYRAAAASPR